MNSDLFRIEERKETTKLKKNGVIINPKFDCVEHVLGVSIDESV